MLQSQRNHTCSNKKATGLKVLGRFRISHDSEVTQRSPTDLASEEQHKGPPRGSHLADASHPSKDAQMSQMKRKCSSLSPDDKSLIFKLLLTDSHYWMKRTTVCATFYSISFYIHREIHSFYEMTCVYLESLC